MEEVVQDPQSEHAPAGDNYRDECRITRTKQGETADRSTEDRDAAKGRHGVLVPAIVLRVGNGAHAPREEAHERRQSDNERSGERGSDEQHEPRPH